MRANEMIELSFEGELLEGTEKSHSLIDLKGVFSLGGESIETKGFYDGNGVYKVRFLPEKPGIYTYKISGVIDAGGELEVEQADEKHHGIVRPWGTHLKHSDGTFITIFGTTVYALAHQEDALTEETFKSLEGGAFNKIRMCLFPKHYVYNVNEPAHFAFLRDASETVEFRDNLGQLRKVPAIDTDHPDFEFWHAFEAKLNRLSDMGIQIDLILFHPYDRWGHSHMGQKKNLTYLDYLLRRFSAFPNIWWSMANEYDLLPDISKEEWHEIDEFIAANDPYHHMLSNHNCVRPYEYERPAITHVSLQNHTMNRVPEFIRRYNKPVLYDECCYEGNLKETWGSLSAREMVNRFWKVTVSGGYCTHGEVLLDDDVVTKEQQDEAVLWWAKGGRLKGQSPARIKFLREIVDGLEGPLEDYDTHGKNLNLYSKEELIELLKNVPEDKRYFPNLFTTLLPDDYRDFQSSERNYAGHVGEDEYLFYYAMDCCARVSPCVPDGVSFTAKAIDAWNMTVETISKDYKNGDELRLPGQEYMAVLLTKN